MLASEDRPKRRSAAKNANLESESDVDEAFELPSKVSSKKPQSGQEDEDFQLAVELSKESPKLSKRKSRSSFIFEEPDEDGQEDGSFQQGGDDEEEVFSDAAEEESDQSEDEDAFEDDGSDDEKPVKNKGKKGKKLPVATPKAASKKVTSAKSKKAAQPKTSAIRNNPVPIKSVTKMVSRSKPTFSTPSGVSISGGGPQRRVGLSRVNAPKGPVSPVKISKIN